MVKLEMTSINWQKEVIKHEVMFKNESEAKKYLNRRQWNKCRTKSYKLTNI